MELWLIWPFMLNKSQITSAAASIVNCCCHKGNKPKRQLIVFLTPRTSITQWLNTIGTSLVWALNLVAVKLWFFFKNKYIRIFFKWFLGVHEDEARSYKVLKDHERNRSGKHIVTLAQRGESRTTRHWFKVRGESKNLRDNFFYTRDGGCIERAAWRR